jgi:hypothetical protein
MNNGSSCEIDLNQLGAGHYVPTFQPMYIKLGIQCVAKLWGPVHTTGMVGTKSELILKNGNNNSIGKNAIHLISCILRWQGYNQKDLLLKKVLIFTEGSFSTHDFLIT